MDRNKLEAIRKRNQKYVGKTYFMASPDTERILQPDFMQALNDLQELIRHIQEQEKRIEELEIQYEIAPESITQGEKEIAQGKTVEWKILKENMRLRKRIEELESRDHSKCAFAKHYWENDFDELKGKGERLADAVENWIDDLALNGSDERLREALKSFRGKDEVKATQFCQWKEVRNCAYECEICGEERNHFPENGSMMDWVCRGRQ